MQPILMLTAKGAPGLITINEKMCGESSEVLCLPMPQNGSIYIGYMPLSGENLPITRRLDFVGGEMKIPSPTLDGVRVTAWPGRIYDVEIIAPQLIDLVPLLLETAQFASGDKMRLIRQNGLRIISDGGFTHTLPKEARQASLALSDNLLCISGLCGEQSEFLSVLEDGPRLLFETIGSHVDFPQENTLIVTESFHDLVGHALLHTYSLEDGSFERAKSQQIWLHGSPQWPATPIDTARALMEAVRVDARGEAVGFLSPSVPRNKLSLLESQYSLTQTEVVPLRYPVRSSAPVLCGLMETIVDGFYHVRAFGFETVPHNHEQGTFLITSVEEIMW